MTNYICTKCNMEFIQNVHLKYHIDNNSCKKKSYNCKFCNKGFTTNNSMYRHSKHSCKIKKEEYTKRDEIFIKLINLENENKELLKIKEENELLKKEIMSIKNYNITNNTINNGIINNNIVLIGCGKEDMTKIDKNEIFKSICSGFYSIIKLTDFIHFNPKYPEYHNVYISNIKDKYAMMYDGKEWTLTTKTELIDKLYEDKKNYIENNIDKFIDTLTFSQKNALDRWMNINDEHDKIKEIKHSIKLLLYNKRNIPLKLKEN